MTAVAATATVATAMIRIVKGSQLAWTCAAFFSTCRAPWNTNTGWLGSYLVVKDTYMLRSNGVSKTGLISLIAYLRLLFVPSGRVRRTRQIEHLL